MLIPVSTWVRTLMVVVPLKTASPAPPSPNTLNSASAHSAPISGMMPVSGAEIRVGGAAPNQETVTPTPG